MKQRTVRFTHIMSGREKNVAIAHIYYDGVFYEWTWKPVPGHTH